MALVSGRISDIRRSVLLLLLQSTQPQQAFGLRVGISADHQTQVCSALQWRHRMSDKQLRIIAWRLNPSFSPEHSLIKLETELSRFGHLILASWLIRSTLTAGKAVRALRLLICGFVVVNGLCVTAAAGLDSRHHRSVSRAENISSNQASSKNGPPTIGPGTRGISVFWQLGHSSTLSVVSVTSPMFRIIFL
jgi:hypothetical protein